MPCYNNCGNENLVTYQQKASLLSIELAQVLIKLDYLQEETRWLEFNVTTDRSGHKCFLKCKGRHGKTMKMSSFKLRFSQAFFCFSEEGWTDKRCLEIWIEKEVAKTRCQCLFVASNIEPHRVTVTFIKKIHRKGQASPTLFIK